MNKFSKVKNGCHSHKSENSEGSKGSKCCGKSKNRVAKRPIILVVNESKNSSKCGNGRGRNGCGCNSH